MRVAQMLIQRFRRCVLFLDSPSEGLFIEIVIKMHKIKLRLNKKPNRNPRYDLNVKIDSYLTKAIFLLAWLLLFFFSYKRYSCIVIRKN